MHPSSNLTGKLLIAPRLDDRYPTHGVLASIVQVGRMPSGGAAAVVRGERRAHIGSGTTGPGAALWVEVTEVEDGPAAEDVKTLAAEYKKLLLAMLQRREAWQLCGERFGIERTVARYRSIYRDLIGVA